MIKSHTINVLSSRDRLAGGTSSNFRIILDSPILLNQASHVKQYFMRFENINIPLTFYNIDSNFNTFKVIETDGVTPHTITIVIDEGNYTISELIAELETQLDANTQDANNYTLTYDITTNKITFKYDAGTSTSVTVDTIDNGSTLNYALGFGIPNTDLVTDLDNNQVFVDGVGQDTLFVVNVDIKSHIHLETGITTKNYHRGGRKANIGVKINMDVDRNQNKIFQNHDGALIRMNNSHTINHLEIRLVDDFGNIINLNGSDWTFDFNVYELTLDK